MALTPLAAAQSLYDRFFDEFYFPSNPTAATSAGIHTYDSQLEDYSKNGVVKKSADLKKWEAEFEKEPPSDDRDLVVAYIHANLLELENIKQWEKNPDLYSSGITNSAYVIMSRKFAPEDARLKSLIDRERQMMKVLQDARVNLANPPRIYTEVAIEQLPGNIDFFAHDVPLAFVHAKNKKLTAEFKTSNDAVIAALKDYEAFLKHDLLARSNGDFRLGAENYSKKLLYEEMVDTPLDRLLEIGYQNLRDNQRAFRETAAKIDASKTPQQILAEMEKDHPAPDQLLKAFRDTASEVRNFVDVKKIVTVPSPVPPMVQETPPFMRALTSASMDTPGPYEKVAKEAFLNVTLPEKDWPADRVEDYMESFHRGVILSTTIHEAYPGHYVQFLWVQKLNSKVRKLLGANTNVEGWAHYCEQMLLDEGYTTDPRMRLGQLQDALLRNARFIVGIEMHTGKRTFDQGVEFFEKEGYQTHEIALKETKRGTSDPIYLYYTLGKLQILKLRDDYRKLKGAQFSLQEFHDNFLKQGFPPIKIVRHAMLGNDSPSL
ncbi:MAG: DUF885 domain-containing protein [Bryobacterales bacterium]|nr:DUF885 domain-containing protein [Bryobacterales bacterium]MBV9396851.1 DUF885 domain-containing protein [Bryobacterales bacterium]